MIKIRHIILKDELFDWVNNPEIIKIELNHKRNSKLNNNDVCEIFAYYNVELTLITTIIGSCKRVVDYDGRDKYLDSVDRSILTGIQSQKAYGFLSKSIIIKLIEIEKKYDVNLLISKEIMALIEKNK